MDDQKSRQTRRMLHSKDVQEKAKRNGRGSEAKAPPSLVIKAESGQVKGAKSQAEHEHEKRKQSSFQGEPKPSKKANETQSDSFTEEQITPKSSAKEVKERERKVNCGRSIQAMIDLAWI
jgi:hypothetical protein